MEYIPILSLFILHRAELFKHGMPLSVVERLDGPKDGTADLFVEDKEAHLADIHPSHVCITAFPLCPLC